MCSIQPGCPGTINLSIANLSCQKTYLRETWKVMGCLFPLGDTLVEKRECYFIWINLFFFSPYSQLTHFLLLFFVLVVVVFAFILCWLPFHVGRYLFSKSFEAGSLEIAVISQYCNLVSFVLFYLSAAINPILYNIMSKKYRVAACRLFGLKALPKKRLSSTKQDSSRVWTEPTVATWHGVQCQSITHRCYRRAITEGTWGKAQIGKESSTCVVTWICWEMSRRQWKISKNYLHLENIKGDVWLQHLATIKWYLSAAFVHMTSKGRPTFDMVW